MDINLSISVPGLVGAIRDLIAAVRDNTKAEQRLETKMAAIDDDLTELTADVSANTDLVQSAVTALNGIAQKVTDAVAAALAAGATPAQLQSVTDAATAIKANSAALAAAIPASTPAAGV